VLTNNATYILVIQARVSPLRTEKLASSRADPDQRVEYVTRDQSQNLTQRMAGASGFRGSPLPWAQKALRRASGVWSLGGAGLIPE